MPGQHHSEASLVDEIADYKVIRKVFPDRGIAANSRNGIFAQRDGRPQSKFHAFQKIGDQDASGKFDGLSDSVERSPDSPSILASKYTGHRPNLRIEQRGNHVTQIIHSNFNVAVARHQNVVRRVFRKAMEAIVWRVRPRWLPGNQDSAWDLGIACANFPDHR